jgi:DNA-binding GntR family transcriptional regulator
MVTSSALAPFAWVPTPVSSSTLSIREQTCQALRQAILNFQLKPGQRLVERELIERLGVSRTTLREALRSLAAEGLVTVTPQKGARVALPTLDEASELYEVREALESLIVARFVERATDDEVVALQAAVGNYRRVAERTTDVLLLLAAKQSVYEVLISGARSPTLQQLIEGIKARVQALRATSLARPGRSSEAVNEVQAFVDAIARRDGPAAAELCAQHVRNASTTALAQLREHEEREF